MIIIVEGVDRVGKSTLCELISKEFGFKVFHDTYKPKYLEYAGAHKNDFTTIATAEEIVRMKFAMILQFVDLIGNVVIDRAHLTEFAYDYDRNLYIDEKILKNFDKEMAKRGALMFMVLSSDIEESSRQHGSDLKSIETSMKALYHGSSIKKFCVKFEDFAFLIEDAKGWLK